MIHIADQSFYDRISAQVKTYDAILTEGVRDKKLSATVNEIYQRSVGGKSGLSVQPSFDNAHASTYGGDLDGAAFSRLWGRVPRLRKALIFSFMSGVARLQRTRWFRRWMLGSNMDIEGSVSLDKLLGSAAKQAIIDERNKALFHNCEQMIEGWAGYTIGVIWGAVHIPPLAEVLVGKHGYGSQYLEWTTVFAAND
ncbi:hypothetical protein [Halovulum sp. GXIMD14793]